MNSSVHPISYSLNVVINVKYDLRIEGKTLKHCHLVTYLLIIANKCKSSGIE